MKKPDLGVDQWGNKITKLPKNIKDAVWRHCRECNGDQKTWTEECVSTSCALFGYRPGNSPVGRPERKRRQMGAVQREAAGETLARARKARQKSQNHGSEPEN